MKGSVLEKSELVVEKKRRHGVRAVFCGVLVLCCMLSFTYHEFELML